MAGVVVKLFTPTALLVALTPGWAAALQAVPASDTSHVDVNLLLISVFAFVAVFLVLGTLALLMVALTRLFPAPPAPAGGPGHTAGPDAAVLAAITAAANVAYPGMRVTRVEESR
jgi:hypothetical protein